MAMSRTNRADRQWVALFIPGTGLWKVVSPAADAKAFSMLGQNLGAPVVMIPFESQEDAEAFVMRQNDQLK